MDGDYIIGSSPGVWGWLFNFSLFFAGMFSDLLLVKLLWIKCVELVCLKQLRICEEKKID